MRRTAASLSAAAGAYRDISASAGWAALAGEVSAGVAAYSNGWVVPVDGLYELEWAVMNSNASGGIVGIAVNASGTPNGDALHAFGTVANGGAYLGSGSGRVRLQAGDKLTLWAFGNGGPISPINTVGMGTHWGFQRVA